MTKKQREKHIELITNTLGMHCGPADRWGHFRLGNYRFKMQKTSMRLEVKIGKDWMRVSSSYFKDITIDNLIVQIESVRKRIDK